MITDVLYNQDITVQERLKNTLSSLAESFCVYEYNRNGKTAIEHQIAIESKLSVDETILFKKFYTHKIDELENAIKILKIAVAGEDELLKHMLNVENVEHYKVKLFVKHIMKNLKQYNNKINNYEYIQDHILSYILLFNRRIK